MGIKSSPGGLGAGPQAIGTKGRSQSFQLNTIAGGENQCRRPPRLAILHCRVLATQAPYLSRHAVKLAGGDSLAHESLATDTGLSAAAEDQGRAIYNKAFR
jgi:hypothetical protein